MNHLMAEEVNRQEQVIENFLDLISKRALTKEEFIKRIEENPKELNHLRGLQTWYSTTAE